MDTLGTSHTSPSTFVAMDNETSICHLVALWSLRGSRHFRALCDRVRQQGVPLADSGFLDGGLGGPDELVLTLRNDPEIATVVVRVFGGDTEVEVRSKGLRPIDGGVAVSDSESFGRLLSRIREAVDTALRE